MNIRTRIFLGIFLIVGISFCLLLFWITRDLEPQYRKALEDLLVDTSRSFASVASATAQDGRIQAQVFRDIFRDARSHPFLAAIYDFRKKNLDLRVYATDASGKVLFDSNHGADEGKDYSRWNDVHRALQGRYGARSTRNKPDHPDFSVMYVASPVIVDGRCIGVVSVGKPTTTSKIFAKASKKRMISGGALLFALIVAVSMLLSVMVTRPIQKLMSYARSVRDGQKGPLPDLGNSEIRELGEAFEEMRVSLEGKKYVQSAVSAITHAIKSPVAAIYGAIQLLKEEDLPKDQKDRFIANMENETQRIDGGVQDLLFLTGIKGMEALPETTVTDMALLLQDIAGQMAPLLAPKNISLETASLVPCPVSGHEGLLRAAVKNLVQNAADFSGPGSIISLAAEKTPDGRVRVRVRDHGAGIPAFAEERIFEPFFSLPRPGTRKKGFGVGLSIVQGIVELHQGEVTVKNHPQGGVAAEMILPCVG